MGVRMRLKKKKKEAAPTTKLEKWHLKAGDCHDASYEKMPPMGPSVQF